jgi:hypothetical protein
MPFHLIRSSFTSLHSLVILVAFALIIIPNLGTGPLILAFLTTAFNFFFEDFLPAFRLSSQQDYCLDAGVHSLIVTNYISSHSFHQLIPDDCHSLKSVVTCSAPAIQVPTFGIHSKANSNSPLTHGQSSNTFDNHGLHSSPVWLPAL